MNQIFAILQAEGTMLTNPGGGFGAPASVLATQISSTEVRVTWTAVATAVSYDVDIKTGNNPYQPARTNYNSTSVVLSNLTQGVVYRFRVRADSPNGTSSNYTESNQVSISGEGVPDPGGPGITPGNVIVSSDWRKYHEVEFKIDGPSVSELDTYNPFRNYFVEVWIANQSGYLARVPCHYACDGNALLTKSASGNIWRGYWPALDEGEYSYQVRFRKGTDIFLSDDPDAGTEVSGDLASGTFFIGGTDKTGNDFRATGGYHHVTGSRYLRTRSSGVPLFIQGPDSPENFLSSPYFSGNFKSDGISDDLVLPWVAHLSDMQMGDLDSSYGALRYLISKGLNAYRLSFFTLDGGDRNIFPYLNANGILSGSIIDDRMRIDVSRMDEYSDIVRLSNNLGLFINVVLSERGNFRIRDYQKMINGRGIYEEAKFFYREMISRIGMRTLGMQWNISEKYPGFRPVASLGLGDSQNEILINHASWIDSHDPLRHIISVHADNAEQNQVFPQVNGNKSALRGVCLQAQYDNVHQNSHTWLSSSISAGKPWVIFNTDQNPDNIGVDPDAKSNNNQAEVRKYSIWGNMFAGCGGNTLYFGYDLQSIDDLHCRDWRTRNTMWDYCRHAKNFFYLKNAADQLIFPHDEMVRENGLINNSGNTNSKYCLAKRGEVYAIYLPNGGTTTLDLTGHEKTYTIQWYNPRTGAWPLTGSASTISTSGSIGNPPSDTSLDWAVVVRRVVAIDGLQVINASTDAVIDSDLQDNDTINISSGPISIQALTTGNPGSLKWEVDGVEIHRSNTVHKILPDRKYKGAGNTVVIQTRPFYLGIGIKTIKVTPYSLADGKGTAYDPFEITVEFNSGSSLGLSPIDHNVSTVGQLSTALSSYNDDDTIYLNADLFDCSSITPSPTPTLAKRVKFRGNGNTRLVNLKGWIVEKGFTMTGCRVEAYTGASITPNGNTFDISGFGNTPCFDLQNGAYGILIGGCDFTRCNQVLNANLGGGSGNEVNGIVFTNNTGGLFSGNRGCVMDIKSKISNVVVSKNRFTTLIASSAASEGFKIGQDQHKFVNNDIIWYDNYIDSVDTLDSGAVEVHGIHAFSNYLYIVGNTVKNIINQHAQSDREAYDGAGNYIYVANNYCHNGGARGQEGHFNFKDEMTGCLYEYNLVTSNRAVDSGQGFTVHGENIFRFCKAVLEKTSDSNGGMALLRLYDGQQSYFYNNEYIGLGAKMTRHSLQETGSAIVNVFNNTAKIKTMEESGVFYKNSDPSKVTINKTGGDSLCPSTGKNGGACAPEFQTADWYINHVPTHGGNGWYP